MSEIENSRFQKLLKKYAKGNLSETEQKVVDSFMHDEFDAVKWDESKMGEKTKVHKRLKRQINHKTNKKVRSLNSVVYAAVASIAILIGIFTYHQVQPQNTIQFTTTTNIDSLKLADGSVIVLSPNSILEYPKFFEKEKREVHLIKGNAFFKITKNPEQPFIVNQDRLLVKVLGTSFNIRVSAETTEVDVKTGTVAVSAGKEKQQQQIVCKNEKVVYTKQNEHLEKSDNSDFVNWYDTNVFLNSIDLIKLSTFIENRFGYKLTIEDSELRNNKITITIAGKDNIQDLIDQLTYITDLKFKLTANEIKVSK